MNEVSKGRNSSTIPMGSPNGPDRKVIQDILEEDVEDDDDNNNELVHIVTTQPNNNLT